MSTFLERAFKHRNKIPGFVLGRLLSPLYWLWNYFGQWNWYVNVTRAPVVRRFNKLYFLLRKNTLDSTYFMGRHILKFPTDLWIYQEILFEKKPDVIIETGVFLGGSTYYYAELLRMIGHGRVIAVDITLDHADPELSNMDNVTLIEGSSTSPEILERIKKQIDEDESVMVVLDSDHAADHVYAELCLYSTLVTEGQYLIVEDGLIDSVYPWFNRSGPSKATRRFLESHGGFIVDNYRNRFLLTQNPGGYLLKTSNATMAESTGEDTLRPLRLWLPYSKPLTDMRWLSLLNQNRKKDE